MAETTIEWTDFSFNPWRGCTKVSAGCANCYAETNYSVKMHGVKWGPNGTRVKLSDAGWKEPVKWNTNAAARWLLSQSEGRPVAMGNDAITPSMAYRPRVFCASLADVFEDWTGPIVDHEGNRLATFGGGYRIAESHEPKECLATMDDLRADLFRLIDATPNLDWLILTKRPENIRRMWQVAGHPDCTHVADDDWCYRRDNVWLGTSVENREQKKRIDQLRECGNLAKRLFLSIEPLLEDVGELDLFGISLVIIGGESGPNARPCNIEWMRSIVSQCQSADVACFVKQLGKSFWIPNDSITDFNGGDRLVVDESTRVPLQGEPCLVSIAGDSKGGDITEWPTDLQIREMP